MFFKFAGKVWALFMPLVLLFNSLSINIAPLADSVEITYAFANEAAYSAAGTVTLESETDGEYQLFWGDEDGKKLSIDVKDYEATYSEFAEVEVENGSGSAEIQSFTAIPDGAEYVVAYKINVVCGSMALPENKIAAKEAPVYSFGALSDVHFNRYSNSLTTDDAMLTFPNALNFIEAFDVELVGISGDISADGERDAFEKFNSIVSGYDFPVYTCTGNHDVNTDVGLDLDAWHDNMNTGVYGEQKAEGVIEVAENGIDFVYAPESINGDVFIFFSQIAWDYNRPESRLVTDEQLDWLEEQLELYKDTTVYLFFHTFFADDENNPELGEGNIVNSAGKTYDLVYTVGCEDEVRFKGLLKEYRNVVFFNGHSHWAYDMQKYNTDLNITDYDGTYATMVHVSSVSSPRRIPGDNINDSDEYAMRSSEGYVIKVYENRIVLTGVDFLRGQPLAYATYVIEK